MIKKSSGQSLMEYTILVVIVVAALLTMQVYMKRGISGRWQTSVDDVGDQYDPGATCGTIKYSIASDTSSQLVATYGNLANGESGYYSMRTDLTDSSEQKTGAVKVGN